MTPARRAALILPSLPRPRLRPRARSPQRALFCGCGAGIPAVAGLCPGCYGARARSRFWFDGHREEVLVRDGRRCRSCGGAGPLHVHHRKPGIHDPAWLIVLCAACHTRVHRLRRLRVWLPESFLELWEEQHPACPVQLQLPLRVLPAGGSR